MRILTLLLLLPLTASATAVPSVLGDWDTPTGGVVRVFPCGADVCLKIVKLDHTGPPNTDEKNPDATLRHRPLCGLTIGTGFHQDDPAHLTNGRVYDPKSGHTYSGTVTADGNTLKLHGYIGISLFGRSETWRRSSAAFPACA